MHGNGLSWFEMASAKPRVRRWETIGGSTPKAPLFLTPSAPQQKRLQSQATSSDTKPAGSTHEGVSRAVLTSNN